jgi:hypothetical protein
MIRRTALPLLLLLAGAAAVSGQEAVWAPAFRGTALRRLQTADGDDSDAPTISYTGRGDLSEGVNASRSAAAAARVAVVEEEGEPREGTGAQSPKGYSLVEDNPRCFATLGDGYCAKPGVWGVKAKGGRRGTDCVVG